MMTDKKFKDIFYEVMEEIYHASIPGASFKELMETSPKDEEGRIMIPFEEYKISERILEEIIERAIKEHKLNEYYASSLKTNVYLGPSPVSIKNAP
jgi:isocitrate dehydrogenase